MNERISNWRTQILGRPVPINYLKSPDELPAIRERGRHTYDFLNENLPAIGALHENVMMRPAGDGRATPTAELYVPPGKGPFPVLIHLHGGAWFTGWASGERKFGYAMAMAGFLVVCVDYALAPELPYPCGLEDVVYAARWVVRNIERYGGDPKRLAISGGSAGGNLAAAAALALHGEPNDLDGGDLADVPVRFGALMPQFGMLDIPAWLVNPGYSAGATEIPVAAYLGPNFTAKLHDPLVSPVYSRHLHVLPPTYLTCGALDAMLCQTMAMANALVAAKVPTSLSILEDTDHEFLKIPEKVPGGMDEMQRMINWLRRQIG